MSNVFCHVELTTENTKVAKDFYKKIFKWKFEPIKGMDYTMIETGAKNVAGGVQPKPMPEAPTAWMPYVQVDAVKKTVAKAAKAGAKIVVPFQELPGNGAIGVFVDPTGAMMGVWEAPKKAIKKASVKTAVKSGVKTKAKKR